MSSIYSVNYQLRQHKRDRFIEFIKSLLLTPFILNSSSDQGYLDVFEAIEHLINDHIDFTTRGFPSLSRLSQLCPGIGSFFTPLPLKNAFQDINQVRSVIGRQFIPPSFNDVRYVLNCAQVKAISAKLRLITFDGDMTLYQDGDDFETDSKLVDLIITLIKHDITVAIVTAAGYPGDATRYEKRLHGLLQGFKSTKCIARNDQFFVLGGECNYLFRYCPKSDHLVFVEQQDYMPKRMQIWQDEHRIKDILSLGKETIMQSCKRLDIVEKVEIVQKARSVGMIAKNCILTREQLDEIALATKNAIQRKQIMESPQQNLNDIIPFCCFNGGRDVWLDIGNKLIGVSILLEYLGMKPNETLHVGDQFLGTGNDIATRGACCTVWITSPEETEQILQDIIKHF